MKLAIIFSMPTYVETNSQAESNGFMAKVLDFCLEVFQSYKPKSERNISIGVRTPIEILRSLLGL